MVIKRRPIKRDEYEDVNEGTNKNQENLNAN